MKHPLVIVFAGLASTPLLIGSAVAQFAPTVSVMPAPNRSYDAFQQDQFACRQYADQQVAAAQQPPAGNDQPPANPVMGAVVGAGLGAALGGGRGAAAGAATGATGGSVVGAPRLTRDELQQRYDYAFSQCMSSRGYQMAGYNYQPAPASPSAPSYNYQPAPVSPPVRSYSYQPAPAPSPPSYQPPSVPPPTVPFPPR